MGPVFTWTSKYDQYGMPTGPNTTATKKKHLVLFHRQITEN